MNTTVIRISVTFMWIGFVSAISFMEAWLKFTAPGVTLTTGLAIGQVVFTALNKVELILAVILVIAVISTIQEGTILLKNWALVVALVILLSQTLYILPSLSKRIDVYLSGGSLERSQLHFTYIGLEVMKVLTLIIYGLKQF